MTLSLRCRRPSRRVVAGGLGALLAAAGVTVATAGPALAVVGTAPTQGATYVTNGRVDAIVPVGSRIYLAGAFTKIGPPTGLAAVVSAGTAKATSSWGLSGNSVTAAVPDGSGGWYAGGQFALPSGTGPVNAAHILADGTIDLHWVPRPDALVSAIAYDAATHTVFLGGSFTNVAGVSHPDLVAVNDSSGATVSAFTATVNGAVDALALDGSSHLYLGGDFTQADGAARSHLAAVSKSTGALATFSTPSANQEVRALAVSTDRTQVYVGGSFTTFGGAAKPRLAAVTAATGAVVSGFAPAPSAPVDSLLATTDASHLLVGGEFTTIAGHSAALLARLSLPGGTFDSTFAPSFGTACTPADPDTTCTAAVDTIASADSSGDLDIGGVFLTVHGGSHTDSVQLSSTGVPTGWDPAVNGPVQVIVPQPSGVLIGGALTSVGATAVGNLVALNRSTGAYDPTWSASASDEVHALVPSLDGTQLYLGGNFTTVDGVTRTRLAEVSAATGSLTTAFNSSAGNTVYALGLLGNNLYVGGMFGLLGGGTAKFMGAISATTGSLVASFQPAPNAVVQALGFNAAGTSVYAGGTFTAIGGKTVSGLAALSPTTGVASSWTPSVQPTKVMSMATNASYVCVGTISNHLECYDPITGKVKTNQLFDGNVQAVALAGATVYAGGHFDNLHVGSALDPAHKIAAFDLSTDTRIDWLPLINSALGVFSLSPQVEGLYLGGDFTRIGTVESQGFALLPGTP